MRPSAAGTVAGAGVGAKVKTVAALIVKAS
jgi:hypothetical protein